MLSDEELAVAVAALSMLIAWALAYLLTTPPPPPPGDDDDDDNGGIPGIA